MPNQPKFNVGDIVKLKSGGPDMTIQASHESDIGISLKNFYKCQWFAGKKLESGTFPPESLILVKSEES